MSAPKSEPREHVTVRIPGPLLARVDRLATATGFTRSAQINSVLLRGVKEAEAAHGIHHTYPHQLEAGEDQ